MMQDRGFPAQLEKAKAASLGQLLLKAARLFDEQAVTRIRSRGASGLRSAHTRLLPHIDLAGTRLGDLAERVGVTKQAVGQLVDDLEAFGVARRAPDPADARARLVRFTRKGEAALLHGLGVLGEVEGELAEQVGAARMARLHRDLEVLLRALERTRGHPAAAPRVGEDQKVV